jgi:hypothetical protein
VLVAVLSAATLFGADMFSGTWKENIAKFTESAKMAKTHSVRPKTRSIQNMHLILLQNSSEAV